MSVPTFPGRVPQLVVRRSHIESDVKITNRVLSAQDVTRGLTRFLWSLPLTYPTSYLIAVPLAIYGIVSESFMDSFYFPVYYLERFPAFERVNLAYHGFWF